MRSQYSSKCVIGQQAVCSCRIELLQELAPQVCAQQSGASTFLMLAPTEYNCDINTAIPTHHALRIPKGSLPRLERIRRSSLQSSRQQENRHLKRAKAKSLSPLPARAVDDVLRRAVSSTRRGSVAAALLAELVRTAEQRPIQGGCPVEKPSLLDDAANEELSEQHRPYADRDAALYDSADKLVQRNRQHLPA
eukprot:787-Heterococcus_DN1.PRE.3